MSAEESAVKIDREAMIRDIREAVDFISNEGLPQVKAFVDAFLDKECAEYPEHSDEDFSPEFCEAVNRALSEEGIVTTYEEFKKWLYDFTAEVRARNDEKVAV